jgi:hypothetical protein
MPSALALSPSGTMWLRDPVSSSGMNGVHRRTLTRTICGTYGKHFSVFEFFSAPKQSPRPPTRN